MRHWRWAVVAAGVLLLCSVPVVRASWPVPSQDIGAAELRARILSSADTPFEGLVDTRGGLRLPDLGRLDDEVAPFRQTSRVRVWYAAPDRWRADELLVGGERGVYREPTRLWLWDSGRRRIVESPRSDDEPLRIPRLMDLTPPELGRRLLDTADGETITSIAARRVAGRVAAGLRITTTDPTVTIDTVDLWADPATGLVLAVEIDTGGTAPVLETSFVEVHLRTPSADTLQFDPDEVGVPVRQATTVDPIETASGLSFVDLPDRLGGLPRRNDPAAGLATYGDGLTTVSLLVVPQGALGRRISALPRTERPWGGDAALVETSLVNIQITDVAGLQVVLAGTVTVAELDRIAGALVASGGVG